MPSLAITGIIGSGKSIALALLSQLLNATSFSADEENRRQLEGPEVRQLIRSLLGDSCYDSEGKPDRPQISKLITSDPAARTALESILHPRLERIWRPLAEGHRQVPGSFFVAEIPLLYEKGLESFFDKTIVIGCSDSVRKERLEQGRSISPSESSEWMKIQQPQHEKLFRADHLIWNDGSHRSLELQIHLLSSLLKTA